MEAKSEDAAAKAAARAAARAAKEAAKAAALAAEFATTDLTTVSGWGFRVRVKNGYVRVTPPTELRDYAGTEKQTDWASTIIRDATTAVQEILIQPLLDRLRFILGGERSEDSIAVARALIGSNAGALSHAADAYKAWVVVGLVDFRMASDWIDRRDTSWAQHATDAAARAGVPPMTRSEWSLRSHVGGVEQYPLAPSFLSATTILISPSGVAHPCGQGAYRQVSRDLISAEPGEWVVIHRTTNEVWRVIWRHNDSHVLTSERFYVDDSAASSS